jgi:hypothetical protein
MNTLRLVATGTAFLIVGGCADGSDTRGEYRGSVVVN